MISKLPSVTEEKINYLRLIRSENVGSKTFYQLLDMFGSAKKALENLPLLAERGGKKSKIKIASEIDVKKELEKTEALGGQIICSFEKGYPLQLLQIDSPPPVLTFLGDFNLLNRSMIAIVGARNASTTGVNFSKNIAEALGKAGIAVISGLAKGIDTGAHIGSIDTGTIAVIAGGINNVYPKENRKLYKQISQKGLLISEQPLDSILLAKYFPMRNRIISGLARAVIIVEATAKSGTLITARFALSQNKKVYAVPGSPLDPRYEGTNRLIRTQQAELFESAQNVIDYLNNVQNLFSDKNTPSIKFAVNQVFSDDELAKYRSLLPNSLSFVATPIEDLVIHSKIPLPVINLILLEMELAGKIERVFGNKVRLITGD